MIASPANTDRDALVLVDRDDVALGTAPKLEVHRDGRLHRAVSVLLFDDEGRVLLQQRSAAKYHSAGLWANTACGHPRPGETVLDAARRRLRAEMGIDARDLIVAGRFVYRAQLEAGLVEHELDHVVVGRWTGAPSPDAGEVAAWAWIAPDDLARELRAHPERYAAWLAGVVATATR
jgi:isopentenyl-diphosphate delta-isomerase